MLDNSTSLIAGGTGSFGNTFVPMTRKNTAFLNFEEWVRMVWVWSQTSARQTRFPIPLSQPPGARKSSPPDGLGSRRRKALPAPPP